MVKMVVLKRSILKERTDQAEPVELMFEWTKNSFKSYSANVGPLTIYVKQFGIPGDKHWCLGEICGANWVSRKEFATAEEAMVLAESEAGRQLKRALAAFTKAQKKAAGRGAREKKLEAAAPVTKRAGRLRGAGGARRRASL